MHTHSDAHTYKYTQTPMHIHTHLIRARRSRRPVLLSDNCLHCGIVEALAAILHAVGRPDASKLSAAVNTISNISQNAAHICVGH